MSRFGGLPEDMTTLSGLSVAVQNLSEALQRPVESASIFYSLLYLNNIAEMPGASFDFSVQTDRLYDAFELFSFATIIREASVLEQGFYLDGFRGQGFYSQNSEYELSRLVRHFRETVPEHRGRVGKFIRAARRLRASSGEKPGDINEMLRYAEREFSAVSEPDQTVRMIQRMFDAHPTITTEDLDENPATMDTGPIPQGPTGWIAGYDGPAWVGICDHFLRREEFSKPVWVDQSWSIEHNNSVWLDKIDATPDQQDTADEHLTNALYIGDTGPQVEPPATVATKRLLDANQNGNLRTVMTVAQTYDDAISLDLSRVLRRREIPGTIPNYRTQTYPATLELTSQAQAFAAYATVSWGRSELDTRRDALFWLYGDTEEARETTIVTERTTLGQIKSKLPRAIIRDSETVPPPVGLSLTEKQLTTLYELAQKMRAELTVMGPGVNDLLREIDEDALATVLERSGQLLGRVPTNP